MNDKYKSSTIYLRVPREYHYALKILAEHRRQTVNAVMRKIIYDYLSTRGLIEDFLNDE